MIRVVIDTNNLPTAIGWRLRPSSAAWQPAGDRDAIKILA
jgi:hypothetical protein